VLQLANSENVNDFIQCRVKDTLASRPPADRDVIVSIEDAARHSFVGTIGARGGYAFTYDLSR